ncbi:MULTISPECIES: MCE family protein [Prauserella salsuginis group]|uniref:MCE family protein n=1 Tax=Prauserella salsuginis TaxID=387889 RepID=A0ABW6G8A9_9PSEU|nr:MULTISPECIES: MCE family protein [Prauserella salsuginis group]MCR3721815.1 phospholipid/cholesterol/gamma-HCH transport system substrate-binding protein [Prauserella flava]MCR3734506.1 phospholipid/cholesterol/gamma-HCH transport system substrate-binding protein [Prauserella salsuginis]
MRLERKNRLQLVVFGLISLLAVGYAGGTYAGLDRLFGNRGYLVHIQLSESGGIFENAEVAYRGVTVGRVTGLNLDGHGVTVDVDIDSGTPDIPADSDAVVANRSAVGEQYVDLRPRSDDGPYLEHGSTIDSSRTGTPVPPGQLLGNLNQLVSSVDPESLRTVVDELDTAFTGAGPDLGRLLDSAGSLTAQAKENLPQTAQLLRQSRTVLDTQRRNADQLRSIAGGFRDIASQLKKSDSDLRNVIDRAPAASREISALLDESGTSLSVMIANLLTTSQVLEPRTDALEHMMVALPMVSGFSRSVVSNGEGHLGFVPTFFDPHGCTKGYEGTERRPANDTRNTEPNTEAYCAEPQGSPSNVRGAQNAPVAGEPVQVPGGDQDASGDIDGGADRDREESRRGGQDGSGGLPGLLDFSATGGSGQGDSADSGSSGDGMGGLLGVDG